MEDQVEIVEYLSEIKNVSPRSSLVIAGASFYLQYKRTRSLPIDSTSTWNSLEKATRYAQNIDTVAYAPYDGQMITVKENGKTNVYILVLDESLPLADKRVHCKLEPVASQSFGDDRYARKDIKDTFKKGFTSKEGCDIEGGLNVGKMTRLSGGVVVMADTDYGVTESEKENPENSNVMAIGLTEVPKNSGFGSTSLGEMDNTDESFDLVPDGNYMMQKRAGVFYPVKAAAGGGGTKLTLAFVTPSNMTAVHGKETLIKYTYSSTLSGEETGEGIATYTLNNKQVASETINQGEVSFNIGKYLILGDNILVVQVTDSYGATRKLTFKINAVSIAVTSTFDDSKAYTGAISFPYTPMGAVEKTIHFLVDDKETGTYITSVSNRQQTYSIPAQAHGAHTLDVYATATINDTEVESDHLRYDIISIVSGNNTPVIASSFRTAEVEQFSTLLIPYIVYNPATTTSDITLSANGTVISDQTIDRTRQTWSYRAEAPGDLELKIACGSVSKIFNLTVTESEIDVRPEEADLVLFLTSVNRSNNEEGKNIWNYGEIFAVLTAFNYATNGWIKTVDGFVALRVNGDARVTIPYNSFANDFRSTGKTIEFEFETRDVTDYDSVILSCMNGGIGLEVTAQKAIFRSEQTSIDTQFKEDERVRISFVIEKKAENRLIFVYINGEICGLIQYPEQDNFTQPNPAGISIGSSDCTADIFNIRVYDNALNRYQLLDNYIADMDNLELKRKLYARNNIYDDYGNLSYEKLANQNISFTIVGELPTFKGDKKTVTLVYEDREHPERSWVATGVEIDVQGTSSQWYPRKNFKTKCKQGFTMTATGEHADKVAIFEEEIPVNVFCFKADFAESSGVHNTGMARLIDYILRGMGFLTEAQKADPRVRTTVNGRPSVMWHQASEDAEKTSLGKYNFNNDKSTNETFGFKAGCESWEILNNTSDRVLFKRSDYITVDSEGNIEWLKDFEARYPDGNEDYTNLKRLTDWLVSVKDNPTKFRAEADQYLDMNFMLSYYTITELFAMVDQRAKNMFLTTFDGIHWICIFYDNDTVCGLNNEGVAAFDYTVEYHDQIGNKDVWNGAESTLWNNIEQTYSKEIAAMYAEMRSKKLLTYEECIRFFDTEQGDAWCEAVYNEDSWYKYVRPLLDEGNGSYLYAAQGSRKMHRCWWLYNRFKYMDSKYIAGDYKNDFATLRLYTPSEWEGVEPNADMTITPYAGQYVNVQYGSYTVGTRSQKNVPVHIKAPAIQFNDTETIIFGAGQISSLGDLSSLYPGSVDVSKMTKLVELIIGSGAEGYRNTNMEVLSVGANNLLRKLDIRNCPNLKQAIDLALCSNIREIWAEGTGTSAVVLPEGGNLTLLHLPDTITNLTVRNQTELTDAGLILDGVQNLSTIRWENTNKANVLSIIDRCFALDTMKLERVRLIGVDWTLSTLDPIIKLISLKGLDENGNNVDKAIITGKCYVSVATDSQINKLKAAFPELAVTYGQLKPAPVTTFTFSSSQRKSLANSAFECAYEVEKVNEYTYKVTSEDNITIDFTFKCENHEDFKGSYLVAGTRSQSYTVTYIPLRKIRVGVYNQSVYVQGATVTIGDRSYISDADGYVTLPRGGAAISGTVSAYGYASNTFSYGSITSDTTNTVYVYGVVDVKFIVKYSSLLIEGATVKCNGVTGTTNQYGECTLSLGKGTYEYSVTHDTYYEKTGNITVGTSATSLTVYVEPNTVEVKFIVKDGTVLLSGATIQCDGKTGITDASGETTLVIGSKKTHEYTVSKNGYFNVTDSVTVSLSNVTVNAAMRLDIESFKPIENGNIQMLVTGENISLYVTSDATDYIISWGDGTEDHAVGTGKLTYDHTYDNSDFHQVEIKNCSDVTYAITKSSLSLVAYWDLGNSNVNNLNFSGFSMLKYVGLVLKNDTERQYFSYCFNNTSLTSIPQGLLDNCVAATSLSGIFRNTLISSIPVGLFDHCTNASTFKSAFEGTLISSIPDDLFRYNVGASDFNLCFANTKITSVPERLFYYCTNAYYFGGADSWSNPEGCFSRSLLESVPANLFINNKKAFDFRGCFQYSKIKVLPAGLLDNCPVTKMEHFCYTCDELKHVILPATVPNLGNYSFAYCRQMKYFISTVETPPIIGARTFASSYISVRFQIYVPNDSVEAYKTATNWTELADSIKPMSQFAIDFPNEEV
ncbi:CotH kinase family protein [Bacteroides thetaiotaomicron]|uniref:CotH kinase family protein n=2 Tax=Bacteroides thetaiotaomicron TaxID=818 RepID=UPI0026E23DDB|nr:CotH kinase family protein [Bacteroides thetaiotaomicron]MDO6186050.1 CotH kinase family protein [Bacteroides thetaiotaomicron]MDO6204975.1 CotH kinase family protein [Bacteroides thetaiotaomicron]MDO6208968.1 CotH kinase family protein [Bacteroides thetaiotaomicron]MDO6215267.1 CotH kinase family protein [Bacteroides thetaiotaomicron]MDO6223313.1 CotH kinase family protein [Bacteroides thetaiotaomicron]